MMVRENRNSNKVSSTTELNLYLGLRGIKVSIEEIFLSYKALSETLSVHALPNMNLIFSINFRNSSMS